MTVVTVCGLLTPLVLLAVLVALGRYEELVLPPLADEPDAPEDPGGGPAAEQAGRGGADSGEV